jgi:hypothetical protein
MRVSYAILHKFHLCKDYKYRTTSVNVHGPMASFLLLLLQFFARWGGGKKQKKLKFARNKYFQSCLVCSFIFFLDH